MSVWQNGTRKPMPTHCEDRKIWKPQEYLAAVGEVKNRPQEPQELWFLHKWVSPSTKPSYCFAFSLLFGGMRIFIDRLKFILKSDGIIFLVGETAEEIFQDVISAKKKIFWLFKMWKYFVGSPSIKEWVYFVCYEFVGVRMIQKRCRWKHWGHFVSLENEWWNRSVEEKHYEIKLCSILKRNVF